MPWVETESPSFAARHDSADSEAAAQLLEELEGFRVRLAELFEVTPSVSVVIHPSSIQLGLAHPWLPLARMIAAPAGRRYFAGWFSAREIHVLGPEALEERASAVRGSLETLRLTPLHEYAHVVVGANNPRLPPPFTARRVCTYARWAWLCEGAATYLSGQERWLRPAIARRLHEGRPPHFPPSARDALLFGGTVFGLLERLGGTEACVSLATSLSPHGQRAAIEEAFGARVREVEGEWRRYLTELTELRAV